MEACRNRRLDCRISSNWLFINAPGVAYCEIWSKVGSPAPTDIGQMTHLGNASRTPPMEEYPAAQKAGPMATYWLRWVSPRGDKGPWVRRSAPPSRGEP